MFILTIDCTSKSTNEYNNLKNDKIIKLRMTLQITLIHNKNNYQ